jgi:hypothetical protein
MIVLTIVLAIVGLLLAPVEHTPTSSKEINQKPMRLRKSLQKLKKKLTRL